MPTRLCLERPAKPQDCVTVVCSINGCDGKVFGHGWCNKHYKRWRKHGDPLTAAQYVGPPPRFQGGERVGRLTVLEEAPQVHRGRSYRCCCDCGVEVTVRNENLGRNTFSCGCMLNEKRGHNFGSRTHGMWGTPTWVSWDAMRDRCYQPTCNGYHNYGGRGIRVCDRWRSDFAAFLADMGERPEGMTLDRIDPDGNYEPGNCRWATASEQRRNVRQR